MATSLPSANHLKSLVPTKLILVVLVIASILPTGSTQVSAQTNVTNDALIALSSQQTPVVPVQATIPADEFWMVNTRCITSQACCADLENPRFSVSLHDGQCKMVGSDISALVDSAVKDPVAVNVIYAHGNNFEADEVLERAWFVFQHIRCNRTAGTPIRFIAWSWPSQPVTTPLKDVRLKAERTDAQGLYMALFLRQISSTEQPITLIGFSFGGRVVTGALHALAGGSLGGRVLPGEHQQGLGARLGLVAPALDNDWLMPGKYHALATKNAERISLMYNPRDLILRRYWILDPDSWSKALGQSGGMQFGPRYDGTPIVVQRYNCTRFIGRRHGEEDYYSRECSGGAIMARLLESP